MIDKLKQYFGDMLVYKNPEQSRFFATLSLPSFMRDWLVMKFSDESGEIDKEEVSEYVKRVIPKKEQWEQYKYNMSQQYQSVKFLAKVKVEIDISTRKAFFYLPDFGFPKKKGEAIVSTETLDVNKDYLLKPNDVWGIVELICSKDNAGKIVVEMIDFNPFCPYSIDLEYYADARKAFGINEWLDIIIGAIDYNPNGYLSNHQKMTMLVRLLSFIEKRVNLIELAPKGTGKSYIFSQISKYGWLVSGGSISRAKFFYDIGKRTSGLAAHYDYVAFDEIQSIIFPEPNEMQGALKGYLESGQFRIGDYSGIGESGLVILGNIDEEYMDINTNLFISLPNIFRESALLDRFHGFIKGWDIPRMREDLKANGWALNVEYFSEIMHLLRNELIYRAIVDEILDIPKDADTRDTEAIKRVCTGLVKLLFPHYKSPVDVIPQEFISYCLNTAKNMRRIIKIQMGIIDSEFRGKDIPDIKCKLAK